MGAKELGQRGKGGKLEKKITFSIVSGKRGQRPKTLKQWVHHKAGERVWISKKRAKG